MSEPIRDAATVILWRKTASGAEILMGQRGASAVFMPSKYVFPGGAVDGEDVTDHLTPGWLNRDCTARLTAHGAVSAATLVTAAQRELAEETGLALCPCPDTQTGAALTFVFRAITPPGRSRRFDARFFLANAANARGDMAAFSAASGELTHLHWISLGDARALDLPFITEVVLAEVSALITGAAQVGVPFFDNSGPVPTFRRLD